MLNSTSNSKYSYKSNYNSQQRKSLTKMSNIQQNNIYIKKMPSKFRKILINRANKQQKRHITQGQQLTIDLNNYHNQSINHSIYQNHHNHLNHLNHSKSQKNIANNKKISPLIEQQNQQPFQRFNTLNKNIVAQVNNKNNLCKIKVNQNQKKDIKSFVKNLKSSIKHQLSNKRNNLNQYDKDMPITLTDYLNHQNIDNRKRSPTSFSMQNQLTLSKIRNVKSSMSQLQKQKCINSNRSINNNEDKLLKIQANIDQIIKNKLIKLVQREKMMNVVSKTSDINLNSYRQNSISQLSDNKGSTKQIKSKPSIFKIKMNDAAQDLILDISSNNLSKLIKQLRQIKDGDQNRKNDDVIQILNKKIQMIQKIMAQNSLESQAMKKYYFARLSQKKKNQKSPVLLQSLQSKKNSIKPPIYLKSIKSIKMQSISKRQYKSPKSQDYDLNRYKQKPFQNNLQPFPRSSYKRDYLKYSQLKQKAQSCKKKDYKFAPDKNYYRHQSIYSGDYKSKNKVLSVNYKELDAYRDKFKDLQISYNPQSRRKRCSEQQNYLKQYNYESLKMKNQLLKRSLSSKRCQTLIQDLSSSSRLHNTKQTQNHRQFKGVNGPASVIKNKVLEKLKYSFREMTQI